MTLCRSIHLVLLNNTMRRHDVLTIYQTLYIMYVAIYNVEFFQVNSRLSVLL